MLAYLVFTYYLPIALYRIFSLTEKLTLSMYLTVTYIEIIFTIGHFSYKPYRWDKNVKRNPAFELFVYGLLLCPTRGRW